MKIQTTLLISALLTSSALCFGEIEEAVPSDMDLLARVGDRAITFPQLNTQLNSTAVVGLSTPALGTPERRTVMLTLLDKAISVNLLYLDAIDKGVHESSRFQQDMQTYTDGMLAGLYRKTYLRSDDGVSETEMAEYTDKHFAKAFQMDEKMRPLIEAKIRKQKYLARKRGLREHLYAGMNVTVYTERLKIEEDKLRSDDQVIAEYGGVSLTWGESKKYLTTLNNTVDMERRLKSLNEMIDNRLLTKKALQSGMQRDPAFLNAVEEFKNTRLVNQHRDALVQAMQPSDDEIRDYYREHRNRIAFNEHRKLQMVVVKDERLAEEITSKLKKGEMTIYQAALNHSIDPRAEQTLGDFGWVEEGSGFPALDELAFSLEIGELGGPVETPAGWHIVIATDQRSAKYNDINDPDTQQQTRRLLLKQRLDEYVINLRRQNRYPVVVYEENLNRLLLQEAQWIAAKNQEMAQNPQRARIILEEMKALIE